MANEYVTQDGEVLDRSPSRLENLEALSRASEVAVREANSPQGALSAHSSMFEIVTAQRVMVPRDLPAFIQRIKTLAAVAGETYYYSIPVRKKNKQTGEMEKADPIEGETIQLAQDLAREYGNCAVDTRVFDIGDRWVIYARFTDYERGFSQVRPYLQRKGQQSIGGTDRGRQEDAAFQIGVSKAVRNVIVKSLDTFAGMMFEQAKSGLVKAVSAKLDSYKARIQDRLTQLNVPLQRVEAYAGAPIASWNATQTAKAVVELRSISEGMATPDEVWPVVEKFIDPTAKEDTDHGNGQQGNPATAEGNAPGNDQGAQNSGGAAGPGGNGGDGGKPDQGGSTTASEGPAPAAAGGLRVGASVGAAGPSGPAPAEGGQGAGGNEQAPENPIPPGPEHVSQGLATAYTELLAMQTPELVQVLDQQAKEALTEADYALFEKARDERLATLLAKAPPKKKR